MNDLLPDLCDLYPEQVQIAEPVFQSYGKRTCFYGQVVTVSCFEDNSRVRELVNENGQGKVMVVDGGGSKRRALLGDMLAEKVSLLAYPLIVLVFYWHRMNSSFNYFKSQRNMV